MYGGGASSGLGLATGPKHAKTYEVVGAGTNNSSASGTQGFRDLGIDTVTPVDVLDLDYEGFCEISGLDPKKKDSGKRYHEMWMNVIEPFKPDAIALSGYFKILSPEFLQQCNETWNVHPAALYWVAPAQKRGDETAVHRKLYNFATSDPADVAYWMKVDELERTFKGESAVFDALLNSHDPDRRLTEIRATVHRATEEVDAGPIEVVSPAVQIDRDRVGHFLRNRNYDQLQEYADALQEILKNKGDVPAYLAAVELRAEGSSRLEERTVEGRVKVDNGGIITEELIDIPYWRFIADGKEMPYGGLQMW